MKKKPLQTVSVLILAILAVLIGGLSGCGQVLATNTIPVPGAPEIGESGADMCITFENGKAKAIYNVNPDYMTLTEPSPGKYVLSIKLNPNPGSPTLDRYLGVMFSIYNDGNPTGYSLNIGDSRTNNGWSGDAGTQSHDAELQVQNNSFTVFGSDYMPGSKQLTLPADGDSDPKAQENFFKSGKRTRIRINHNKVSWWFGSESESQAKVLTSPYLFNLNDSADAEGSSQPEIHIGLNRTIYSASRSGSGITTVYIYLEQRVPSTPGPTPIP